MAAFPHPRLLIGSFLVTLASAWALLGLSDHFRPVELIVAAVLQVLVVAMLARWQPGAPRRWRFMLGTFTLAVSVALLRDGSGTNPGVGAILLLPIVLGSLRARRSEVVFAFLVGAAALYAPEIFIGGSRYPASQLRGATITLLVGASIGVTVVSLVRELGAQQRRERELADAAQDQLVTQDAVARVATLVASGAPATELFAAVSEQLARVAGSSMAGIARFDAELKTGEVVGRWRADGRETMSRIFDLDGTNAASQVAQTGLSATVRTYPHNRGGQGPVGAEAAVSSPIHVGGRLWGCASAMFVEGETIPPGLQERIELFTQLVAMAVSNAEMVSELVELASVDSLTGIANRRAFDERLARELLGAARHNRPLAVAIFDVDHFKAVNDQHGHAAGDRVLARIAQTLADEARGEDMVARIGGEEFVWLMPDTDSDAAVSAAERARVAVEALSFENIGSVTVSAGVNSNVCTDRRVDLLGGADAALYAAKRLGRAQTVAAPASLSVEDERVSPAAA